MNSVLTTLYNHRREISEAIEKNLADNRQFMLDVGLLKGGIGDIEHITESLWKEIWYKFIEKTDPLIINFTKEMSRLFERQRAEVIANMKRNPYKPEKEVTPEQERFINSWMFDRDEWVEEFADGTAPNMSKGILAGGVDALDKLDVAIDFDPTDAAIVKYVKVNSFKYAKEITETTEALLKNSLGTALTNGESVEQMMKRVNTIYDYSAAGRARTIAQTEMIGSVNYGALEGNKQSGVVWGTQWIGSLDDRIREDHAALTADEVAVALGDDFPIVNIQYPGDPSGEPEQVINCRCTTKPLTREPK